MTSFGIELQVWYGILFRVAGTDPACPPLPDWARPILDKHGPAAMARLFTQRGYAGEELTWLCYETPESSYWAVAVAASVQRTTRSIGEVNTAYPDDVAERWADSLGQAAQILGLHALAVLGWYQTCSYEPVRRA